MATCGAVERISSAGTSPTMHEVCGTWGWLFRWGYDGDEGWEGRCGDSGRDGDTRARIELLAEAVQCHASWPQGSMCSGWSSTDLSAASWSGMPWSRSQSTARRWARTSRSRAKAVEGSNDAGRRRVRARPGAKPSARSSRASSSTSSACPARRRVQRQSAHKYRRYCGRTTSPMTPRM